MQIFCPGVKKPSSSGHAGVKRVGVEVAHDQTTVSVIQEKHACSGVVDHEAEFLCLALVMKVFKAKSLALESETCP